MDTAVSGLRFSTQFHFERSEESWRWQARRCRMDLSGLGLAIAPEPIQAGKSQWISVQKHATLLLLKENHLIRHTVAFKLKHPKGSNLESAFLKAAQCLVSIPQVGKFECLRQVSNKNNFDFGLSMEFATQSDYDAYNSHPDHIAFVETRWKPEVAQFLEIDYVLLIAA